MCYTDCKMTTWNDGDPIADLQRYIARTQDGIGLPIPKYIIGRRFFGRLIGSLGEGYSQGELDAIREDLEGYFEIVENL